MSANKLSSPFLASQWYSEAGAVTEQAIAAATCLGLLTRMRFCMSNMFRRNVRPIFFPFGEVFSDTISNCSSQTYGTSKLKTSIFDFTNFYQRERNTPKSMSFTTWGTNKPPEASKVPRLQSPFLSNRRTDCYASPSRQSKAASSRVRIDGYSAFVSEQRLDCQKGKRKHLRTVQRRVSGGERVNRVRSEYVNEACFYS
jgi:hypothetical protein